MARVAEEVPFKYPICGGDIRLIAVITKTKPIQTILKYLGEPLKPPPLAPARGAAGDWEKLFQAIDDCDVFQASSHDLPAIDIHSLRPVATATHEGPEPATRGTVWAETTKALSQRGVSRALGALPPEAQDGHPEGSWVDHQPERVAEVPLTRLCFVHQSEPQDLHHDTVQHT